MSTAKPFAGRTPTTRSESGTERERASRPGAPSRWRICADAERCARPREADGLHPGQESCSAELLRVDRFPSMKSPADACAAILYGDRQSRRRFSIFPVDRGQASVRVSKRWASAMVIDEPLIRI